MKRPPKHTTQRPRQREQRPSACKRGYNRNWQRLRLLVLRAKPLCEDCQANNKLTAASEVDHRDGNVRNLEESNLVPLCKSCHSRKTVLCDGGLGLS